MACTCTVCPTRIHPTPPLPLEDRFLLTPDTWSLFSSPRKWKVVQEVPLLASDPGSVAQWVPEATGGGGSFLTQACAVRFCGEIRVLGFPAQSKEVPS